MVAATFQNSVVSSPSPVHLENQTAGQKWLTGEDLCKIKVQQ